MPKVHSLFTVKKDVNSETVSKSTKIKKAEKNTIKNKTLQNNTSTNTKENITAAEWVKSTDGLPQEFRPVLFNSNYKKPIYGYRMNSYNYIVNTPYHLDLFKKKHDYLEWQYIDGCINIKNCPNGFPDCSNCKLSKK